MHLRPVTQADLYDFSQVVGLAMFEDEVMDYVAPYKDKHPDSFYRHCLYRAMVRYYRGEFMFICVSDENDADWAGQEVVMGYCAYSTTIKGVERPVRGGWLGSWFEQQAIAWKLSYTKLFKMNKSADETAEKHFRTLITPTTFDSYFDSLPEEHKAAHGKDYWELELLGTHPDHRRKGVGKHMLKWGFRKAREYDVPLVLAATVMGEKLYLSTGFREVKRIAMLPDGHPSNKLKELDLGQGKGKGLTWACMAWEPESIRGALNNGAAQGQQL